MLKKFLGAILAAALSLLSLGLTGSAETNELDEFEPLPEIAKTMELQEKALDAYDILRTTFTIYSDRSESYPDDFAGTWVNAPYLHIALTSDKPEVLQKYQELLKEFESIIIYETAEYSMNELDKIRFSVSEALTKEHLITRHYIDVMSNKIVFEFSDFGEEIIRKTLLDLGIEDIDNLFVLKKGEPIEPNFDLIGGARTNVGSNSASNYLSLGICGTFSYGGSSYDGHITSGHNLSYGTQLYRNTSIPTTPAIGSVMKAHYGNGYVGDYALVRKTDATANLTNKALTSSTSYVSITGTMNDIPPGTVFTRYGANTGYSTGYVSAINASITYGVYPVNSVTIYGMTIGSLHSGYPSSANGDSGGPYRVGAAFVGIHSGGTVSGNTVYFTPYIRFNHEFTAKTR